MATKTKTEAAASKVMLCLVGHAVHPPEGEAPAAFKAGARMEASHWAVAANPAFWICDRASIAEQARARHAIGMTP